MSDMVTVQSPAAPVGPMAKARLNAQADLDGKATPSQVQWLAEHPQLWLRALSRMDSGVTLYLAQVRAKVDALRASNTAPRKYHESLMRLHSARADWLGLKWTIRRRKDEVIALIGTQTVSELWMTGDVADQMMQIVPLLDSGDPVGAREKADHFAQVWAAAPTRAASQ